MAHPVRQLQDDLWATASPYCRKPTAWRELDKEVTLWTSLRALARPLVFTAFRAAWSERAEATIRRVMESAIQESKRFKRLHHKNRGAIATLVLGSLDSWTSLTS